MSAKIEAPVAAEASSLETSTLWIDVHSHLVPNGALNRAGKWGPDLTAAPDGGWILRSGSTVWKLPDHMSPESLFDPSVRAARADEMGIDMVGVSAAPHFFLHWIDEDLQIALATSVNDSLMDYCSAFPDKFFWYANVPLGSISAAVVELDRAAFMGARAINVPAEVNGHTLDDDYFMPLWEKAVEHQMPVWVHPLALNAVNDPGDDLGNPKYDFNTAAVLSARLGYLYQEASTVIRVIMSGLLDRLPDLKFCLPHGGGFLPYQYRRFELTAQREPGSSRAERPFSDYLRNFYFDTIVHDVRARRLLVDVMGVDNVIVGSNFPGWDEGNGFEFVQELGLPADDAAKIMGGNAMRLFRLDARREMR